MAVQTCGCTIELHTANGWIVCHVTCVYQCNLFKKKDPEYLLNMHILGTSSQYFDSGLGWGYAISLYFFKSSVIWAAEMNNLARVSHVRLPGWGWTCMESYRLSLMTEERLFGSREQHKSYSWLRASDRISIRCWWLFRSEPHWGRKLSERRTFVF